MKKLLSIKYSAGAFNFAMLVIRLCVGILMMNHGYQKLIHFSEMKNNFMNFMGIGMTASLILVVFAEFFCSLFIVIGLFTRLAAIPLIISMSVALLKVHAMDIFGKGEMATLYLAVFFMLLLIGPGRISVDSMISK
jgi:putative oxidoreductase